jgi:hypothetical protein
MHLMSRRPVKFLIKWNPGRRLDKFKPAASLIFKVIVNLFHSRRHALLRSQFAAAVGKRMATERTIVNGKASITEHHRTARWAENEYSHLYELVRNNSDVIDSEIRKFDASDPSNLFIDYVRMLTSNSQYVSAEMAGSNMVMS